MGRHEKFLERILHATSDTNISFVELCKSLKQLGFEERVRGDHHIFVKEGIEEILNLQPKGSKAKPYQVKQVRNDRRLKMVRYEVIIYWSDEDQAFIAEVSELAGCMADGASYQTALANAEAVIQEWIEVAKDIGCPIPEPKGRSIFA